MLVSFDVEDRLRGKWGDPLWNENCLIDVIGVTVRLRSSSSTADFHNSASTPKYTSLSVLGRHSSKLEFVDPVNMKSSISSMDVENAPGMSSSSSGG